jgi:hypothetical protein
MPRSPLIEQEILLPGADADDLGVFEFLEFMGQALTQGDTNAAVSLWDTPAFVMSDDMVQAVLEPAELMQFFAGARESYNARGVMNTRPEIVRLDEITDRIVSVRVRWPWLDDNNREVGAETSTYTLRRNDAGDWKLRVAVMHGVEAVN